MSNIGLNITERGGEILIGITSDLPIGAWSEEAQDRLLADILANAEPVDEEDDDDDLAAQLEEVTRDSEMEIEALKCKLFYLCVAVVAAGLIGFLFGMLFQFLVKRVSS